MLRALLMDYINQISIRIQHCIHTHGTLTVDTYVRTYKTFHPKFGLHLTVENGKSSANHIKCTPPAFVFNSARLPARNMDPKTNSSLERWGICERNAKTKENNKVHRLKGNLLRHRRFQRHRYQKQHGRKHSLSSCDKQFSSGKQRLWRGPRADA